MTTTPTVLSYGLRTAAEVTGFSKTHLTDAIRRGELRAKRSGRLENGDPDPRSKWVVMAGDLQAYLDALPEG